MGTDIQATEKTYIPTIRGQNRSAIRKGITKIRNFFPFPAFYNPVHILQAQIKCKLSVRCHFETPSFPLE